MGKFSQVGEMVIGLMAAGEIAGSWNPRCGDFDSLSSYQLTNLV